MGKHKVARPSAKRPAVFLDRNGTLIVYVSSLRKQSQVRIIKGTPEALRILRELGYLLIVITNQSVVNRGIITARGLEQIHEILNERLRRRGGWVDAFYFCPHEHKDMCLCRKPGTLMIKQAVKKYNIDLKKSFFIGDSTRDIETGRRAKIKTILVKTGKAGRDIELFNSKPHHIAKNLLEAAKMIKKGRTD